MGTMTLAFGLCCAYLDNGRLCHRPATRIDIERGGCVCAAHAPPNPAPASESPPHYVRLPDGRVVPYAK
jgi:hypothetical protein